VRVQLARRFLLVALAIVFLILAVMGITAGNLGYAIKFPARKRGKENVLVDSGSAACAPRIHYNLLFQNKASGFSMHWV